MSSDPRHDERAVVILNGFELEALLEVLAGVERCAPDLEKDFETPELAHAWGTLRKKIVECVGPNGETTSPGGSERLH